VSIKAIIEPIFAFAALVVLSPLLFVLALIVKVTSTGPIFYGDAREGKDARAFKCWKFRSMLTNADDLQRALAAQQKMDGPQFKMENDPRVTKIGRILRKLNVDELPQLWNVVRGEMSFVGPRPSPFRENQICVPWRNGRLSVRPGITGLWQVCRKDRETGDFHQWIHYDLLYVRNVSFRLDVMILGATIVTLGGRKPVPLRYMIGRRPRTRTRRVTAADMPRYRLRSESLSGTAVP
jgi:lipopolysaccharide/colanic/teichoic acid biosynthesis glycosyltransferase